MSIDEFMRSHLNNWDIKIINMKNQREKKTKEVTTHGGNLFSLME